MPCEDGSRDQLGYVASSQGVAELVGKPPGAREGKEGFSPVKS